MIIRLSSDAPPLLIDLDRLDRLHAECPGELDTMVFDAMVTPDPDGDHVWLDIVSLRAAAIAARPDPEFADGFDATLAYAASKGWCDRTGREVRAHVTTTD